MILTSIQRVLAAYGVKLQLCSPKIWTQFTHLTFPIALKYAQLLRTYTPPPLCTSMKLYSTHNGPISSPQMKVFYVDVLPPLPGDVMFRSPGFQVIQIRNRVQLFPMSSYETRAKLLYLSRPQFFNLKNGGLKYV